MKKKVILLVEDNQDDIDLTKRVMEKHKVANVMVVVEDGQEALDYLFLEGKHKDRDPDIIPAVVLLDIKLPKVDGLEVLKRIREDERTRLTPVVMLTSSREDQDLVKGYTLGCNSYILKPVDFREFSEAVSKMGLYWLLLNEAPPIA